MRNLDAEIYEVSVSCLRRVTAGTFFLGLSLHATVAFAEPFTLVQYEIQADAGYGAGADETHIDDYRHMDNASTTWIRVIRAIGDTGFGAQGASFDMSYGFTYGYVAPGDGPWHLESSYALEVLSVDGTQSPIVTTSIDQSFGHGLSSLEQTIIGELTFTYGQSYVIQSTLDMDASGAAGEVSTDSVWSDVFTFHGGQAGSTGKALFTIGLKGSVFAETYITEEEFWWGWLGAYGAVPWGVQHSYVDFSEGAVLKSLRIPGNAWVETASGTTYAVHVTEPSPFRLLTFGLLALATGLRLRRRQGSQFVAGLSVRAEK